MIKNKLLVLKKIKVHNYIVINLFTIRRFYNKIVVLLMKNELRNFNGKNNIKFRRRDEINW